MRPWKIAGFFGDLFDFDFYKHEEDKLDLLYEVTARHLVIMFHAFDSFQKYDNELRNQIIDSFLQKEILEKSKWNEYETELDVTILKEGIEKYSKLCDGDFRMKKREQFMEQSPQLYGQQGIGL